MLAGNGAGGSAAKVDYTTPASPWGVAIGDVDGDGCLDLASANGGAFTVSVYCTNASGGFLPRMDYSVPTTDGRPTSRWRM